MEAKELRLGNWVCDSPGRALQVNLNHFLEKWFWDALERGEITPIPLTEKWVNKFFLINFPFEIFGDNQRGFHIAFENGDWLFIKYVHQLQNLYFALTGEELELKPV